MRSPRQGSTEKMQPVSKVLGGDYALPALLAFVSFIVYVFTLSPSINFGDSPELIAGAYTLGIPHPPGYPLYSLLAKPFSFFPFGESLAWKINLASAFFSAAGLFFLALILVRLNGTSRPLGILCAIIPLVFLTLSPTFWSQAVIAEVYALNFFFFSLLIYIALRWREKKEKRLLLAFFFLFGLGLANHHTLVAMGPLFFFLVILTKRDSLKDFGFCLLLVGVTLLGISVYIYLPLRSLQSPPLDWGDPETFGRFLDVILRRQFPTIDAGLSFNRAMEQVAIYGKTIAGEFPLPIILVGLFGCIQLFIAGAGSFLFLLALFLVHGIGTLLFLNPRAESFEYVNVMMIPSYALLVLAAAAGVGHIEAMLSGKGRRPAASIFLIFVLSGLAAYQGYSFLEKTSQRNNYFVLDYGNNLLKTIDQDGVMFVESDTALFPLWYLQFVEGKRLDVAIIDVDFLMLPWFKGQIEERYKNLEIKVEDLGKHSSGKSKGRKFSNMIDAYKARQMEVIVDSVIDSRPVYVSYEFGPVYRQFKERRDLLVSNLGLLYKVSTRFETLDPKVSEEYNLRSLLDYPVRDDPYFFALSMAYMNILKRQADTLLRSGRKKEGMRVASRIEEIMARSRAFLKKNEGYLAR